MHSSPFTVAGMPLNSSTSSSHAQHSTSTPNIHTWGSGSLNTSTGPGAGPAGHVGFGGGGGSAGGMGVSGMGGPGPGMTTSFSDSHGLAQSRGHYQAGYLMSSQNTNSPPGGQHNTHTRPDEPPIVQTKAKMNQMLSGGSTADFGMDSMFESTRRQRQKLADEDAPPTSSVFDIPHEVPASPASHIQLRAAALDSSFLRRPQPSTPQQPSSSHHRQPSQQQQQPVYVIVFGYPIDKYSLAVEYFQSLGSTATQPDVNVDIQNCFRIGYHDPAEAMRAVRKNGEVLGGSWMIGVKYADPIPLEPFPSSSSPGVNGSVPASNAMETDSPPSRQQTQAQAQAQTPIGTPIRLAPSSSAFRRNVPGTPRQGQAQDGQSQQQQSQQSGALRGWGPVAAGGVIGQGAQAGEVKKGMLGQVSDLIFGW